MDKVLSAVDITLSKYPGIGKDELVGLFLDYIETHLKDIFARIERPSRAELKQKRFLEARKRKQYRLSEDELRGKEVFVEWLERIKPRKERTLDADFFIEGNGWESNTEIQLPQTLFNSSKVGYREDIYYPDFEVDLPPLAAHTLSESYQKREIDLSVGGMGEDRLDKMIELISEKIQEISRNKLEDIRQYYEDDLGFVIEITVTQNDKEAFETWLRLIDAIKPAEFGITLSLNWTGENILKEEEFVHKAVDIMLKSGVGPRRTDKFSAIEELEEGWV